MTEKELKRVLSGYPYFLEEIRDCNERICGLSTEVVAERDVSSVLQDGIPRNRSAISDPTYRSVERILEKYLKEVERLEIRKAELFDRKSSVERFMETLQFEERRILELRYFKKYHWGMVASTMKYSERQCHNTHAAGIKKAADNVIRLGIEL